MDVSFLILIAGALLLSVLHAAIPNHWLPFVVLQREQGWSRRRLLAVTGVSGLAHVTSTVLIGVAVGFAGSALATRFSTVFEWVGPAILVGLGLWLVIGRGHHHREHPEPERHHHHSEHDDHSGHPHAQRPHTGGVRAQNAVTVGGLVVMMFFSPCLELEAYYLPAAEHGWLGILAVSAAFLTVTVGLMLVFVSLASEGIRRVHWRFLERHERLINGGILIAVGVLWKLVHF